MANICNELLTELATAALQASGASPAAAASTAAALVAADMQHMPSHGVSRIPFYCEHLKSGRVDGEAIANIVYPPLEATDKSLRDPHGGPAEVPQTSASRKHTGAAILVDAANGLAFPACDLAVQAAITTARRLGVAYAAITRSNHYGMAAHHLQPVAAAGMIGLTFSNAPAAMPAAGGKRAMFGTNPIAAIFPRRAAPPILIDLSLSEVAKGKLMVAARDGKSIPLGWATDAEGNPTTDPSVGLKGLMLPMGGTKGAMLALVVELLCAGLAGSALSAEAPQFFDPADRAANLGQGFLVLDPAHFAGQDVFLDRVEALVTLMLADPGVRLPGARRNTLAAASSSSGIEIPDALLQQLNALADNP